MKCPFCNNMDTGVIESRSMENDLVIRRRRFCKKCNKRFTTHERIEIVPLVVIKKDKRREVFNRDKIIKGIIKACEKRSVSMAEINQIAEDIEERLKQGPTNEFRSEIIGRLVMDRLKSLDEVAYVRFASVYRHFEDVGSFLEEINRIKEVPESEDQEREKM
ncbi:MAG: transcriptional regulator NrdR [Candidatus Caldatribacteriota bacterium]|jgi:transcriptional repressor NrdR|nr:transcriptional regulator NrdR [Atribacterota bacterium]MDD3031614.1 transcriptional regulator NrdR [Atribacterota bacterium]MDD3640360.1 transcriptional regulator NrdR [Atribacterota bacterium]MDD4288047.1 transcriptional regulator NrdR [Atribacterota bacterium]MDD4764460.1 transcriptional regulator NrdR [Atribacterota bacterium]